MELFVKVIAHPDLGPNCKGYQQMTKVAAGQERGNFKGFISLISS